MKGKKAPAARRPPNYADILNIKAEAKRLSTLRDKEGFGPARLRRVLDTMNEYADSIRNGYITIQDLQTALRGEAGRMSEAAVWRTSCRPPEGEDDIRNNLMHEGSKTYGS